MDLLALPLPWFELLAKTALTPAEIGRLQRVCRQLWQILGADQVWRKSSFDSSQPNLNYLSFATDANSFSPVRRVLLLTETQAHFVTRMGFGSSLPHARVASGHGAASGGRICASNVAVRGSLHCEPPAQMDGASYRRTLCQCGCAHNATTLFRQCERRTSGCSSDYRACVKAGD